MKEQEVPDEVQAAMGLKLVDDVRKLIREEMKKALEDKIFIDAINGYHLSHLVFNSSFTVGNSNFQNAVKQVIISQMNKY